MVALPDMVQKKWSRLLFFSRMATSRSKLAPPIGQSQHDRGEDDRRDGDLRTAKAENGAAHGLPKPPFALPSVSRVVVLYVGDHVG